jgi:hypothetical protein
MLTFAQAAVSLSLAATGFAAASPADAGVGPIAPHHPPGLHAPLLLAKKSNKPQGPTAPDRIGHNPPPTNTKPHAPSQATGATPTSGNVTSPTSPTKR